MVSFCMLCSEVCPINFLSPKYLMGKPGRTEKYLMGKTVGGEKIGKYFFGCITLNFVGDASLKTNNGKKRFIRHFSF